MYFFLFFFDQLSNSMDIYYWTIQQANYFFPSRFCFTVNSLILSPSCWVACEQYICHLFSVDGSSEFIFMVYLSSFLSISDSITSPIFFEYLGDTASKPRPISADRCAMNVTDWADISTGGNSNRVRKKLKISAQTY